MSGSPRVFLLYIGIGRKFGGEEQDEAGVSDPCGCGCSAVLVCGGVASAITYGQPDGTRHPNDRALVGTFDGETYPYCSGTLISPTVFLTATHCDIGTEQVYVTFDSTYTSKAKLYRGTFYAAPVHPVLRRYPRYSGGRLRQANKGASSRRSCPLIGQIDDWTGRP